jgi:hypothetical protein
MSILLINLGTSDISVKIGTFFIPIGFDRNEPNMTLPPEERAEISQWANRSGTIKEFASEELGIELNSDEKLADHFREFTRVLLERYKTDPEYWHPRISMDRIWGAIKTASNSRDALETLHCFVTDQIPAFKSDTIYLFEILQRWLQKRLSDEQSYENSEVNLGIVQDLPVKMHLISFNPNDLQKAVDFYSTALLKIENPNSVAFVSAKGGTPNMQTALQLQSMAIGFKAVILLDTQADPVRMLNGEPAQFRKTANWRLLQIQKFESAKQLLLRWDFDGARTLLEEWRTGPLQSLSHRRIFDDLSQLKKSNEALVRVNRVLSAAVAILNFDSKSAQKILAKKGKLDKEAVLSPLFNEYDPCLSLLSQCRIYAELNQVAFVLIALGSFYELAQNELIKKLGGYPFFDVDEKVGYWSLRPNTMEEGIWASFRQIHSAHLAKRGYSNFIKDSNSSIKFKDRFIRMNFIRALIESGADKDDACLSALKGLEKLDVWHDLRNDVIHRGIGASKKNIDIMADQKRQENLSYQQHCKYSDILAVMSDICRPISNSPELIDRWDGYYIFGAAREWIFKQLDNSRQESAGS